jgi:glycosyltransferase involved in cell wall biosynthesis
MRILFVHQNFPGQYKHLAPALAARGHEVRALSINRHPVPPGVQLGYYRVGRGTTKGVHRWAAETETKVLRGEACAQAALELRAGGFVPDVICAHPGWGEALFLREVWPQARQLHFVEFYYSSEGADVGFDPEFGAADFDNRCRVRMKNANSLLNLDCMDKGVSPTAWQKSTVPAIYQPRIAVIHDGIDTRMACPDAGAEFEWSDADGKRRTCRAGDEVVTFVNRNLEPNRGYHSFMRSLPDLLARRPGAEVLIVGGDGVSYGAKPVEGSYKQRYLEEVAARIDTRRVHFLGRIPYASYLRLLQVSAAHVYLTYPFVLSWSMLEAMSAGCVVIGSRTPPVEEVIRHGENGLLVDFFSAAEIAEAVAGVLEQRNAMSALRQAARESIRDTYDLAGKCLPAHIGLVESLG